MSLSDLGIAWKRSGGNLALPAEIGGDSGAALGFAGSGTGLAGIEWTVPLHRLSEDVDGALLYPKEFLEEGIEGEVEVKYVFEPDRAFDPRRAWVRGRSRFLRVYVLRLLTGLWPQPLPALYFKRGHLPVRFYFRFELTNKENPVYHVQLPIPQPKVAGNALYFERKGKLIGSWNLGPISGYGILPAVAIDPEWFVDRVQELLGQKERPDPLRKWRRDPLF